MVVFATLWWRIQVVAVALKVCITEYDLNYVSTNSKF